MAYLIGVAGGSCSGKTTLIEHTRKLLGDDICAVICQDNYYIDRSDQFDFDGGSLNFDHPEAIDFGLLAQHLRALKEGQPVEVPQYDFATHSRREQTLEFQPRPLILVDGILILDQPQIREALDYSFFVECDSATRLKRRINRDVAERGRTEQGVIQQFERQVAPMHEEFVEPSKEHADRRIDQILLRKQFEGNTSCVADVFHSKTP